MKVVVEFSGPEDQMDNLVEMITNRWEYSAWNGMHDIEFNIIEE
jgi:hypothetical protein